jgi:hypothetical protein
MDNTDKPEDQAWYSVHKDLGELFEKHGITDCAVIFKMPNVENPSLYYRGHFYDAAKLLAGALRSLKTKIVSEID